MTYGMPKQLLKNIVNWIQSPLSKIKLKNKLQTRYQHIYEHSDQVILLSPSYIAEFAHLANITDTTRLSAIHNPNTFVHSSTHIFERESGALHGKVAVFTEVC